MREYWFKKKRLNLRGKKRLNVSEGKKKRGADECDINI